MNQFPYCNKNAIVGDIIHIGTWNIPGFVRGVAPKVVTMIEEQQIGEDTDDWVWKASVQGEYTLKSAYETLRSVGQVVWWWKIFWFSNRIPKHSFVTWMTVRGGLKTLDKMYQWGVVDTRVCIICNRGHEKKQHHFYRYKATRSVWNEILMRV